MGYEFQQSESVIEGVRRIADEQLSKAIEDLATAGADQQAAIHEVRKHFKKLRSLIRLIQPGFESRAEDLNDWFRQRGRQLARARDAASMLEAWQRLRERFYAPDQTELLDGLAAALGSAPAAAPDGLPETLAQLTEELRMQREETVDWNLDGDGLDIMLEGLADCYAAGRRALRSARKNPSNERLHEWRKRSKDHWYHLRLWGGVWPGPLKAWSAACEELCDLLGDDHDLAGLADLIESPQEENPFVPVERRPELLALIARRREDLQREAFERGRFLFAEKKKSLRKRLLAYWKAWRR
jgi:CHAD domain-containing protein